MAKGDKIRVLLDVGALGTIEQEVLADKAGRSVAFTRDDKKNLVEITVEGRAGTAVRTVQLRADRVLLIEEVPA